MDNKDGEIWRGKNKGRVKKKGKLRGGKKKCGAGEEYAKIRERICRKLIWFYK